MSEKKLHGWQDWATFRFAVIGGHDLKKIQECDNRWLRVIVRAGSEAARAVTVIFDMRLRRIP